MVRGHKCMAADNKSSSAVTSECHPSKQYDDHDLDLLSVTRDFPLGRLLLTRFHSPPLYRSLVSWDFLWKRKRLHRIKSIFRRSNPLQNLSFNDLQFIKSFKFQKTSILQFHFHQKSIFPKKFKDPNQHCYFVVNFFCQYWIPICERFWQTLLLVIATLLATNKEKK